MLRYKKNGNLALPCEFDTKQGLTNTNSRTTYETMTQSGYIQGRRPGFFSTIARSAFLAVAAIGGLFMLIFSAAFVLFLVAGIAVIGFLIFGFFWVKAKITGRPFGPRAQFEQMRKDMESQMSGASHQTKKTSNTQGPIVDAHQTPQGWSVDD